MIVFLLRMTLVLEEDRSRALLRGSLYQPDGDRYKENFFLGEM
jgi:hypothetical protein